MRRRHKKTEANVEAGETKWLVFRELYIERLETRYPGSDHPEQVRRVLHRFTKYRKLVERTLGDITDLDLELYVQKRREDRYREKPLSPRTINNEIQILNSCFALAGPKESRGAGRRNWGLIATPPFIEELDEFDTNPVVVSADQVKKFVAATRFAKTPSFGGMRPQTFWVAALVLDAITGLRRGALLRVPRPTDEQFRDRRELFVPAAISKTRRDQVIALGTNEKVFELLWSLPSQPAKPLLPWYGRNAAPMTLGHFNNEMARFQREAGTPESERIKTKHLRSTVATELAEEFSDSIAKNRLGHAPGSKTLDKHYKGRRVSRQQHEASDYLAERLVPLLEDGPPTLGIVG